MKVKQEIRLDFELEKEEIDILKKAASICYQITRVMGENSCSFIGTDTDFEYYITEVSSNEINNVYHKLNDIVECSKLYQNKVLSQSESCDDDF